MSATLKTGAVISPALSAQPRCSGETRPPTHPDSVLGSALGGGLVAPGAAAQAQHGAGAVAARPPLGHGGRGAGGAAAAAAGRAAGQARGSFWRSIATGSKTEGGRDKKYYFSSSSRSSSSCKIKQFSTCETRQSKSSRELSYTDGKIWTARWKGIGTRFDRNT